MRSVTRDLGTWTPAAGPRGGLLHALAGVFEYLYVIVAARAGAAGRVDRAG
jgi:hypothetical protein